MSGFIVGADRSQATMFPELLDDYVDEESAVRVIDVFVDELDSRVFTQAGPKPATEEIWKCQKFLASNAAQQ